MQVQSQGVLRHQSQLQLQPTTSPKLCKSRAEYVAYMIGFCCQSAVQHETSCVFCMQCNRTSAIRSGLLPRYTCWTFGLSLTELASTHFEWRDRLVKLEPKRSNFRHFLFSSRPFHHTSRPSHHTSHGAHVLGGTDSLCCAFSRTGGVLSLLSHGRQSHVRSYACSVLPSRTSKCFYSQLSD